MLEWPQEMPGYPRTCMQMDFKENAWQGRRSVTATGDRAPGHLLCMGSPSPIQPWWHRRWPPLVSLTPPIPSRSSWLELLPWLFGRATYLILQATSQLPAPQSPSQASPHLSGLTPRLGASWRLHPTEVLRGVVTSTCDLHEDRELAFLVRNPGLRSRSAFGWSDVVGKRETEGEQDTVPVRNDITRLPSLSN